MSTIKESSKVQNSEGIIKIAAGCNCYLIDKHTLIDTGTKENREFLKEEIEKVCSPDNIRKVIFTHLHYDHISNWDLFSNAGFFASKAAIKDFTIDPLATVLRPDTAREFKELIEELQPLTDNIDAMDVIASPGHTRGSIMLYHRQKKVLFTGDTYFYPGLFGRTDLPTSVPEQMPSSLEKINKYKGILICPGHDYERKD